jgi:hypothetical protein
MAESIDKVIKLNLGYIPDSAVSRAMLLQTERAAFLTFHAMLEGRRIHKPAGVALVEFPGCVCTQFGYPDDEALEGHPLYSSVLDAYALFEVSNSSWIKRLEQQNRVAFPQTSSWNIRHFIITFHDSTFECLAIDLVLAIFDEPYELVWQRIKQRIVG